MVPLSSVVQVSLTEMTFFTLFFMSISKINLRDFCDAIDKQSNFSTKILF